MAIEYINAVYKFPRGSVTATEIAVLAFLANKADPAGRCWPTRSTIAEACHLHADTVKSVLQALAYRGFLKKENRHEGGRVISATIVLLFQPLFIVKTGRGTAPPYDPTATGGAKSKRGVGKTPEKNQHSTINNPSLRSGETPARKLGQRIDPSWEPSQDDRNYALAKGFPADLIPGLAENMRDWHLANPTAKALKADWAATWRTWVRREMEKFNGRANGALPRGIHSAERSRAVQQAGVARFDP